MASVVSCGAGAPNNHQFKKSIKGEQVALAKLFKRLPAIAAEPWLDLRDDTGCWKKGVDYQLRGGVQVDFKVEHGDSGNCAAELLKSDRPSLVAGWLFDSHSHWIIHYFEQFGDLVCLPKAPYRDLVLNWVRKGLSVRDSTSVPNGDKGKQPKYITWCALLPFKRALDEIPGAFWCHVPGASRPSQLSEKANGLSVPPVWLAIWLQQGAQAPLPTSPTKAELREWYAILKPFDRCKYKNSPYYIED